MRLKLGKMEKTFLVCTRNWKANSCLAERKNKNSTASKMDERFKFIFLCTFWKICVDTRHALFITSRSDLLVCLELLNSYT